MPPEAPVLPRPVDAAPRLVAEARRQAARSAVLVQEAIRLRARAAQLRAACLDTSTERFFGTRRPPLPPRPPRLRTGATVAPGRRDARAASRVIDVGPRRPAPSRP